MMVYKDNKSMHKKAEPKEMIMIRKRKEEKVLRHFSILFLSHQPPYII